MCMGCGTKLLQSVEVKTPDTMDSILLFMGFVMWVVMLNHIGKKLKFRKAQDITIGIKKGSS